MNFFVRLFLTSAVVLLASKTVTCAPPDGLPPAGSCKEDLCIDDYRGDGTDADLCITKSRLFQYCPAKDELCLAAACEESEQCVNMNGFSVSSEDDCESMTIPGLSKGHGCFCCKDEGTGASWAGEGGTSELADMEVSVCGDDVTLEGTVAVFSPDFPYKYPTDVNCQLTLAQEPEHTYLIDFFYFDFEGCDFDTLSVNVGSRVYDFSGSELPPMLYGVGDVSFTFSSDESVRDGGFYAVVTDLGPVNDICDNPKIYVEEEGLLFSHNFPGFYGTHDCKTTITSPPGTTLLFEYLLFDYEVTSDCIFAHVEIGDVTGKISRFCGTATPTFTASTTNSVSIKTYADGVVPEPGFIIQFTVVY